MRYLRFMVRWWVARLHLNDRIVCEMSASCKTDFHDYYHDTEHKCPDHFVPLRCVRCGKEFWM